MKLARLALCVALASCNPRPAWADPPPGADPSGPVAAWFRGLKNARGISCCDIADCRATAVEHRDDGTVWALISKEAFGPAAPDEWRQIPPQELGREHAPRPPGVRGSIVCFLGGMVRCADLESGT